MKIVDGVPGQDHDSPLPRIELSRSSPDIRSCLTVDRNAAGVTSTVDRDHLSADRAAPTRHSPRLLAALAAVAGGLATETAFPGRSWWPMAYLGIALLLLGLRRDSVRQGFVTGTAFGLAFFLPHLWWANEAVGQPAGWLALSALQATAVGAFGAAWVRIRRTPVLMRSPALQVIAAAVLWVAMEQLRGRVPFGGFPWGVLAFSQTDAPLIRLASVGGQVLVSLGVAAIGALLALAVELAVRGAVRSAVRGTVLAIAAVLVPVLIPLSTAPQAGTLTVGAVQGDVPTQGAEAMEQARQVAANHVAGTDALRERASADRLDVVVWPESASDIDPRTDVALGGALSRVANLVDAPILVGTQRFEEDVRFNDYLVWEPGRGPTASYTKQKPVPFGEYIPYRQFFRALSPAVDLVRTDMAPGTGVGLLEVPITRLGREVGIATAICFEVAYGELVREAVVAGSELIVIPTNNASFGWTQESVQQLAMSRFRAVEHGRAVVQISTVGVSAMVGPDGSVLERTELFTSDQMMQDLPLRTSLTLADRLGRWPAITVDALAVLLLLGAWLRGLRPRSGPAQRSGA